MSTGKSQITFALSSGLLAFSILIFEPKLGALALFGAVNLHSFVYSLTPTILLGGFGYRLWKYVRLGLFPAIWASVVWVAAGYFISGMIFLLISTGSVPESPSRSFFSLIWSSFVGFFIGVFVTRAWIFLPATFLFCVFAWGAKGINLEADSQ